MKILRSIYHIWASTLRFEEIGKKIPATGPAVMVLWHSKLFPLVYFLRDKPMVGLASLHRDADPIVEVMLSYGMETVRGSSTKGSVKGLIGLLRALKHEKIVAITPDGPKGPARKFKEGALWLAHKARVPMVFVGVGIRKAWKANSWDKLEIPIPFSKCFVNAKIVFPPPNSAKEAEEILNSVTRLAELAATSRA